MPGKGNKSLSFAALAALYLLLCVGSLWGCSLQQEEQVLEEAKIQEADAGEEDSPDPEESAAGENEGEDSAPGGQSGRVVVHVCGQVAAPGVYELAEGSRIYEAIEAAGGVNGKAAPEGLNQAACVEDGQQIYVPSVQELQDNSFTAAGDSGAAEDGRVNINTAQAEELMTLSGIGEAKAAAIIQYREENGGFQSIEELMEISGIKEGVFEKIKDQIKV